jgi:hypothetical protein
MNSNISAKELKIIKKSLPFLNKFIEYDEVFINSEFYKKECVSIFDHCLTREEANRLIFVDKNKDELYSRRQKFKNTILSLNEQTELYTWKFKRHNRFHIQKPINIQDVLKKCDFDNLWSNSGCRYGFLLPEYSAIYTEEHDWTNIVWHTNKDKIQPIIDIVKKSGLFVL